MKKFQIVEIGENGNHAGNKAPADVAEVALRMGYSELKIKTPTTKKTFFSKAIRQAKYFKDWIKAYNLVDENSLVLIQNPFHNRQLNREKILLKLKNKKNIKVISFIHDVEELRKSLYDKYHQHEFEFMLKLSDVFIVHNEVMKKYFIDKGVNQEKLVVLKIFDYLQNDVINKEPHYSKVVNIAGNLDSYKSKYIGKLGNIARCKFNLYGPNYNDELEKYSNIAYKGSFPVDDIPQKLNEGFGLIWDGDSIETCSGNTGNYLRFNNPHKLSLYLSSGLPVFIWKEAAEASFVEKNKIGYAIDSLKELESIFMHMTQETYSDLVKNVKEIRARLICGEYSKEALYMAENLVEKL